VPYRRGHYRYWTAPRRLGAPSPAEISVRVIGTFQCPYRVPSGLFSRPLGTHNPLSRLQNLADPFQLCRLIRQIRAFRVFWPSWALNVCQALSPTPGQSATAARAAGGRWRYPRPGHRRYAGYTGPSQPASVGEESIQNVLTAETCTSTLIAYCTHTLRASDLETWSSADHRKAQLSCRRQNRHRVYHRNERGGAQP
jgi:hypothetical protein